MPTEPPETEKIETIIGKTYTVLGRHGDWFHARQDEEGYVTHVPKAAVVKHYKQLEAFL